MAVRASVAQQPDVTAEVARNITKKAASMDATFPTEFRAALLYALWAGLALGANALGIATLPAGAGLILIAGIALTSALFVGLARIPGDEQPTATTIIATQVLMGLIWATLYAYFASGTPLMAAGMYATAVGFGLHAILKILHGEKQQLLASNAELQKELASVRRRAERDQLTNAWGRRAILDMLAREKARAERTSEPLCVCLLDIDHFKDMNDRFGHVTGDRILAAFARRVRGALRTMDSVNSNGLGSAMGRVGGEEFIVVLPLTSLRGALRSAERIRKAIVRRPFEGLHQVTVSIGIAELRPGETVSSLIDRADQALYGAKNAGRNRVHCATLDGGPNAIVMPDMSATG
jgi:diguanylate cyclase (GGDEF)-like protein